MAHHYIVLLQLLVALTFLLPRSVAANALTTNKFKFKDSKLYSVDVGLTLLRGHVGALADFDGDRRTDLVVVNENQYSVDIWTWRQNEQIYKKLTSANIEIKDQEFYITNVVMGDFNYDGFLDMLVQGQKSPDDSSSPLEMRLYTNNHKLGFNDPIVIESSISAQPFVIDYDGDTRFDLLGIPKSGSSKSDKGNMSVWLNQQREIEKSGSDSDKSTDLFKIVEFESTSSEKICQISDPHSSAFVDLNGDCLSDIFVVCDNNKYQIWINSKDQGFRFSKEGELPAGTGQVSFADIDGDGALDMVFPICNGGSCEIHITYNQQIGTCTGKSKGNERCRLMNNLCIADPDYNIDLSDSGSNVVVKLDQILNNEELFSDDSNLKGKFPGRIHLGDYNLDGHPDMLFITKKSGSKTTQIRMLQSVPCNDSCNKEAKEADRRTFILVADGVGDLGRVKDPVEATFFDIDDDGKADILVTYMLGGKHQTMVLYNNIFTDGFFLKAQLTPADRHFKREKPYGLGSPGASFKYAISDDNGNKHVYQAIQMPQSAYRPLDTPFCILGLGRSTNYLEQFFVGNSRQEIKNVHVFEGLIPNSYVLVFPFQDDDDNSTSSWRLELFLNRSQAALYILITLLVSLGVLGVTVFVLNALEKRADKREKKEALHVINFDAL